MKIIFLGTPDFAVPALKSIISSHHEVVAVISQPDKARNRNKVTFSPVKECALLNNIKVYQFEKIRRDGVEELKNLNADIMVTCAYGQILSQEIIDITKYGIINIHGSLLPKYRGAAPIQWAVINGEKETGITLMKTEKGIDTGDMLISEKVEIKEEDTAGSIYAKLSEMGGSIILKGLDLIENGKAHFEKQNEKEATHAPMISKEDGKIDFTKTASEVVNHIRGMNPSPSAFFMYDNVKIKVLKAKAEKEFTTGQCGEILCCNKEQGIVIKAKDFGVSIEVIKYEGKKEMTAKEFVNGRKLEVGKVL